MALLVTISDTVYSYFNTDNKEAKMKCVSALVILFASFAFGISSYIFSSSLYDFSQQLSATLEEVSMVVTVDCATYTLGSLLTGFILNRFNRKLCLSAFLFCLSTSLFLAPKTTQIEQMLIIAAMKGAASGAISTTSIIWISSLWPTRPNSPLQTLQFLNSLGTFLAPLLVQPFLATKEQQSRIGIPFHIEAFVLLIASLASALLYISTDNNDDSEHKVEKEDQIDRDNTDDEDSAENDSSTTETMLADQQSTILRDPLLVFMSIFFVSTFAGSEIATFQLFPSFLANHCRVTTIEAAKLTAALGASYTFFRFLAIFTSLRLKHHHIISLNFCFLLAAVVAFLSLPLPGRQAEFTSIELLDDYVGQHSPLVIPDLISDSLVNDTDLITTTISSKLTSQSASQLISTASQTDNTSTQLYIIAVIMGAGFSSTFPAIYAFLMSVIPISNTLASVFIFSGGAMAVVFTSSIGYFLQTQPELLIHLNLFALVLETLLFVGICYKRKRNRETDMSVEKRNSHLINAAEFGKKVDSKIYAFTTPIVSD